MFAISNGIISHVQRAAELLSRHRAARVCGNNSLRAQGLGAQGPGALVIGALEHGALVPRDPSALGLTLGLR